ncbi:hypothetical protein KGF56_000718 [Candida oxycetoniae]|uniref:Elongation factor 1 alpha-like protein n=1 Tax=Candida oxycetoniae TaxID=497107 RepID=A0AAI9T1L1_9ASCO|nr:uncharacterized protein KGF56_000718 [Candida oxycetoniae]KAI3406586.2 hypothetical protein KGF56_000718 [Candida oxycetoniae]
MDFDKDELDYQSHDDSDEFDEDKLTNEEYDLLYKQLAHLKLKLKSYNDEISEWDLKESLYFNYFEVDPSIAELKSKFKPTQLAKLRAQQRERELNNGKSQDILPAESQAKSSSQEYIAIGIEKPISSSSRPSTLVQKSRSGHFTQPNKSHTSILDQFTSGASGTSSTSSVNRSLHSIPHSIPPRLRHKKESTQEEKKAVVVAAAAVAAAAKPATGYQIAFDIQLDSSKLASAPRMDISVFWVSNPFPCTTTENEQKRRRLYDSVFQPITNFSIPIEKIVTSKQNFVGKPSPDDEVLNAQKQAFDAMSTLQISDQAAAKSKPAPPRPKETKPFKSVDIDKEIATNPSYCKPHKSFIVIGHVDAGKSTLMGRLLFDFGIVDAKTVNKLVRESERIGKGSFALAWIMDQTQEERSHGVTVDICATDFEIESTKFTAIDAPGHKDFVPQMISGVSNADFALLVIDSITGEFEAGFALDGQTKEHTILAKNLGIEKICVVVNKMDKEDWNEHRFEAIKSQMLEYLTGSDVDFKPDQIDFIPISGLTGNNVVKRDASVDSFKWYDGQTLAHYLENVSINSDVSRKQVTTEPFYLSVHDVYKDKGELKVIGKITSGYVEAGETIITYPSEETLQVQSIKIAKNDVDFAIKGQLVTLLFKTSHLSNESIDQIKIGDVITKIGSSIKTVKKFIASLHLFNMDKPLLVGSPFVLFRNSSQVPARITKIIEITNSTKKKKKILHLTSKQTARVEIEVDSGESLPLTTYEENAKLGKIVIRREGKTIGAGTVVSTDTVL